MSRKTLKPKRPVRKRTCRECATWALAQTKLCRSLENVEEQLQKVIAERNTYQKQIAKHMNELVAAEADKRIMQEKCEQLENFCDDRDLLIEDLNAVAVQRHVMLDAVCRALEKAQNNCEGFYNCWQQKLEDSRNLVAERDALANRVKSLEEQIETVNSQALGQSQKIQELEAENKSLYGRGIELVVEVGELKHEIAKYKPDRTICQMEYGKSDPRESKIQFAGSQTLAPNEKRG